MRQSPINALLLHPCLAAQSRGKGLEEYFCLLLVCPDVSFPRSSWFSAPRIFPSSLAGPLGTGACP